MSRIKQLFQKYGRTAVGVHFSVYFATFGACYMAVEHGGVDIEGRLIQWGILTQAPSEDGKEDDRHGWMSGMLAGKGSSAAVAFLCTKALGPIRTGITFTATPLLHRWWTGRAAHAARAMVQDASKKPQ